jgi:hypothetical protein
MRSIRVRAEGPGGVSSYVTAAVNISGAGGLPMQGAVLYLDASTLAATTRLAEWTDQSGRSNHFTQSNSGYQPSVSGPKAGEPYSSVVFTGGQYLQSMSMDFDVDLNNAARRDMTVFVVYKPSSSTSSSAITGKGATWCVCHRQWTHGGGGGKESRCVWQPAPRSPLLLPLLTLRTCRRSPRPVTPTQFPATSVRHCVPPERRYYRGGGWAMYAQESNPFNGNMWLTGGKVLGNWGYVSAIGNYKVRRVGTEAGSGWRTLPSPPCRLLR